ncbi:HBL192Cp [Eremothecium sinecaudum]|uniref:HBL192Cp n=1 Tax=Eremothecium sinecaudum TaxID=45286 RepID=A0A109UWA5_9SACH|nr:HBL192Cp [Eremothecium sinecaudum]AMD18710.1 HBL192Cp [Eremothecium sinecaudum]
MKLLLGIACLSKTHLCILLAGVIFSSLSLASGVSIPLYLQKPSDPNKHIFGTLIHHITPEEPQGHFELTAINQEFEPDVYCVGADTSDGRHSCFAYLAIDLPLRYDLIIDRLPHCSDSLKLSLKLNPNTTGIQIVERETIPGHDAQPLKRKKITKTYNDKKAKVVPGTAAFKEDVEPDKRSFIQKNWKVVLIGVLVYAFLSKGDKSSNDSKQDSKKD